MAKEKKKISVDNVEKRGAESKKKIALVGGALIVGAVIFNAFLVSQSEEAPVREDPRPTGVDFTPKGLEEQSFEKGTQSAIRKLKGSDKQVRGLIKGSNKDIETMKLQQKEFQSDVGQTLKGISDRLDEIRSKQRSLEVNKNKSSQYGNKSGEVGPPPDGPGKAVSAVPPPPTFGSASNRFQNLGGKDKKQDLQIKGSAGSGESDDTAIVLRPPQSDDGRVNVDIEHKANEYAGWLSVGYLPVTTLTGVQAGTASTSQKNPSPMLMRVQGNATLPGGADYDLHGCFISGTSYGDARTHRALTDIASISCVDKNDHLVLEETLSGYVVDSDGIQGLRGTLREKRGAALAKATLASMLEGLGNAFSDAQGTAFDSVTGAGTVISGGDALKSSGLNAASDGANTLSQFYLKEVERLFPVIEVPPNRKASVIITKGKSLKWHDSGSLYTKTSKPQ